MLKRIYLLFLLITSLGFTQKKNDRAQDDIEYAKSLKEKYKDDETDIVLLKSKDVIDFHKRKNINTVVVVHRIDETLMNISSRADIRKYMFYDGESSIESFNFKDQDGKNAYLDVKDESYTSSDLFHNDVRVKYANLTFSTQGYQYKFHAKKRYRDVKYFSSIYFTDEYPILEKEIEVIIPDWMNVEIKEINFDGYGITKKETTTETENAKVITYTVKNLPGVYKEKRTPGPSHIYPHLLILSKSFKEKDETIALFNTTQDLYNWYKSLVDDVDNSHSDSLKKKVAELTENVSEEEKIKNIFYWVQDNIRYIAFEDGIAGFKPDNCGNVFKKRYGDCKGMANLTKQMLTMAGFDARLTWIGTKHIAYDYSTPALCVDNHMICTLIFKGKNYFLDATEKYNPFGEYAERIQGQQVLIEDGENFILDRVPAADIAQNTEFIESNLSLEGEVLKGKVHLTYKGESRSHFLYNYNSLKSDRKEDALTNYLTGGDTNFEIENITSTDLTNRDLTLQLDYDIKMKNIVSSFDDEIYIDLNFEKEYSGLELKDRKFDYLFPFKQNYTSTVTLAIPEHYKVLELPKLIEYSNEDFTVKLEYKILNKKLVYTKHFKFNKAAISSKYFNDWPSIIKKINETYNEQIILKKHES